MKTWGIILFLCIEADMSCFQGLFFCPEATSLLLHNFCIYHISPPGHEVCKFIYLNALFIAFKTEYFYLHSLSGNSTRVLVVGSCCNLFWWSSPFCWRLSRSNNWGSQLFSVNTIQFLSFFVLLAFIFWNCSMYLRTDPT